MISPIGRYIVWPPYLREAQIECQCRSYNVMRPLSIIYKFTAAGGRESSVRISYFVPRAVSIEDTISFDSGSISDLNRPMTSPLRPIKNFSKFHVTSPRNFG